MRNFNFHAYTDIWFGEGQIAHLPEKLAAYGQNVLMVYGGGSIKKNGIYDTIRSLLCKFNVVELPGVEPNPRIDTVRRGVNLCREHKIDVILAVGGGSTIDCSKAIAGAVFYDGDAWDIVEDSRKIGRVLPVAAVLTIAATGSEMNKNAVISDTEKNLKLGTSSMNFIPQVSILDPTYTYGVPSIQTAAGTADIMSHVFENYFKSEPGTFVQDKICEGLLETCIRYLPVVMNEPDNYEGRANLMWASTLALNGLCGCGKGQSWSCHPMEHELSAFYDITHGVGLAILTPRWMRHILSEKTVDRFVDFARNVWHLAPQSEDIASYSPDKKMSLANEAIDKLEKFFTDNKLPMHLKDVGIGSTHFNEMAEAAVNHGGLANAYVPLSVNDVVSIFNSCL